MRQQQTKSNMHSEAEVLWNSIIGAAVDRSSPWPMSPELRTRAEECFAQDYFQSTQKFLATAELLKAQIDQYKFRAQTTSGKDLYLSCATLTRGTPERMLVYICSTHGPEGIPGAAILVDQMRRIRTGEIQLPDNSCFMFVHGLDAYGMQESHRTNENNVDLNRNHMIAADGFSSHPNPSYQEYEDILHPKSDEQLTQTLKLACEKTADYKEIVHKIIPGQTLDPKGIFYKGTSLEQSYQFLKTQLERRTPQSVKDACIVDIHSGLGDFATEFLFTGSGNLLSNGKNFNQSISRYPGIEITTPDPSAADFYEAPGDTISGLTELLKQSGINCFGICQEFGTYPFEAMTSSLIIDNYFRFYSDERPQWARQAIQEVFNPDSPEWRQSVLYMGRRLFDVLNKELFDS